MSLPDVKTPFLDKFKNRPWLQKVVKFSFLVMIVILSPFLRLWAALKAISRDEQTQGLIVVTAALLFLGSFVFHWLEDWSYLDSLYFSFITLATIGYGDFTPTTDLTKILTMIYVVAGLGILFGFFDAIAAQRLNQRSMLRRLRGAGQKEAAESNEPPPVES